VQALNAERIWWARLWRRVQATPGVPWAERRWEWAQTPAGHPEGRYRLVRDPTTRLLAEFENALEAAGDDLGLALAALDRLAEHVGIEPLPR
jgi:hypothetical protein